jgi:topoisomerase-4 subunit A
VKIASIDDFTTDRVEIELSLSRGVTADEVIPQLLAYTDCRVSVTSNLVVIRERKPVETTVSGILQELTELLRAQIRAELEYQRSRLLDRQHWLTLEQIFVEKRVYKKIESARSAEAVRSAVRKGMAAHRELFVRPMVEEDVGRLLEIRIRRISAYDIEKNRAEIDAVRGGIAEVEEKLAHLTRTTIRYLEGLVEKFGEAYPRRTHIDALEAVDRKAVARQSIKLSYDRDTGFFGSTVKGDHFKLQVSEFDLILGIADDGSYRIMTPPEKLLFPGKLLYCAPFDAERGAEFTVVYRDRAKTAFAKRIQIQRFIRNREYQLIKDRAGRVDLLLPGAETGVVELKYAPAKRQRVKGSSFDLSKLEVTAAGARGTRLAPKPVSRIGFKAAKPKRKAARRKSSPSPRLPRGGQADLF